MQKIIFLDFDGVLNTEHYQGLLRFQGKPCRDAYGALFAPSSVRGLQHIIDATSADIVVSSSWKSLGLPFIKEMWEARALPGNVIDITPNNASDKWLLTADFKETNPTYGHCKGVEIASWLADNADDNASYVIFDDEDVALNSQQPHFLLINPYEGITTETAETAVRILQSI